jgi:hypothetical protein
MVYLWFICLKSAGPRARKALKKTMEKAAQATAFR